MDIIALLNLNHFHLLKMKVIHACFLGFWISRYWWLCKWHLEEYKWKTCTRHFWCSALTSVHGKQLREPKPQKKRDISLNKAS